MKKLFYILILLIFVAVCGFNIKSSTIMVIHVFGIINFPKIFNETK